MVFQQLGIATVLAALVGLERERRYQLHGYSGFGGVRTFALIGLTGALAYLLSAYSVWLFLVMTGGVLGLIIASYIMTSKIFKGAGATSEIASVLVYMIGIMSAMEEYILATAVTLAVLVILHFKDPLHDWAKHLEKKEIVSTIKFIIIAF